MATRADLDAAIDNMITTISSALEDLKQAVAAGQVQTPEDFTAEIEKIQGLTDAAKSSDPGPQPSVEPPAVDQA